MATTKDIRDFDSLIELVEYFDTEAKCEAHFELLRWNGVPVCPYCESEKVNTLKGKTKRYKCYGCRKQFGIKVGTIFQDSNISLKKWFFAIYLVTSGDKKGSSSYALAKNIKVSQTTAWFILHRIRESYNVETPVFTKPVEVDETFIGGIEQNKHANKRTPNNQGRSTKTKAAVIGILERDGKVFATPVVNTTGAVVLPIMRSKVAVGNTIYSDEYKPYRALKSDYVHEFVCHKVEEYVKGNAHTNNLENYWSHVKRTIVGTYHQVSRKHLGRYLHETSFRYNNRSLSCGSLFDLALANGTNKRLDYKTLVHGKK
ncbi:IS1595 family transposase [Flavobacterium sp. CYK-55]|uniref:IS1595 family transposase n=1 Tax=Flavobacterium sp. CYK-55 TaxID=2835529 RepID=UPI001BCE0719|nr:IS1595 family transposase [Flavobacterium sp. CYK-55]MBS7787656.1 IS1595 family transposase [Flavobacterium sp. CYK-55]